MASLASTPPFSWIAQYTRWLHTRWPAGKVEKLPEVREDGSTNVPGIYVVGDLTGVPLLKFSSDTGARAVQTISQERQFHPGALDDGVDIAIIGSGVSGLAAAIEAKNRGLSYVLYEAQQPFSTIANFPKGKPIFTYPTDMTPEGEVQFSTEIKEDLLDELEGFRSRHDVEITSSRIEKISLKGKALQCFDGKGRVACTARRVIVAIGRSGNFRKLGVPGEDRDKVSNRLHDPKDYCGKNVLVVGGGDSAMEAAIALAVCGARVTLSYRKKEFSRPKPDNIKKLQALAEQPDAPMAIESPTSERVTTAASSEMRGDAPAGKVDLLMASGVQEIGESDVRIKTESGGEKTIPNEAVFLMIGREAPLDFFRRSGINISGEKNAKFWASFAAVIAIFFFLYQWKKPGTFIPLAEWLQSVNFFPFGLGDWWQSLGRPSPTLRPFPAR
jgi:NosR/NirI family nitrous oxide reductase transcriptional regulator